MFSDVTGAEVQCTPFRHVSLPCFIHDDQFVSDLITELEGLDMVDKSNDLYKFKQVISIRVWNFDRECLINKKVSESCISVMNEE